MYGWCKRRGSDVVAQNVVRINGAMPNGEVWSINPRFAGGPGGVIVGYEELQEWAQNIADYLVALPSGSSLLAALSSAVSITSVRTEQLDASGQLVQAGEYILTTPKAGSSTPTKPFQTSIVASLLTGRPGRSYRGRLYWPFLGSSISTSTLRIPTSFTQSFANDMAALLTAIATTLAPDQATAPVVVSQTLNVATPITQISVGDVVDTQRRRRDSLDEARTVQTVPYSPTP